MVAAARFVVSDIGDILSPRKAPETIAPTDQRGRDDDTDANAVQSHADGGNASKRSACEK